MSKYKYNIAKRKIVVLDLTYYLPNIVSILCSVCYVIVATIKETIPDMLIQNTEGFGIIAFNL